MGAPVDSTRRRIVKAIPHPEFATSPFKNYIALYKLDVNLGSSIRFFY
jgi:hypothetical protein